MKTVKEFYGYIRVSSKRQANRKGKKVELNLSLSQETQLDIIQRYVKSKGGILIGYSVEVETGTNPDRAVLRKTIALCRQRSLCLITAKMDRLYRNVEAMSKLMNSKIEFTFCDFPDATRLSIHILSAIAEYEATLVKGRVQATVDYKRSLGIAMGNPASLEGEGVKSFKKAIAVRQDKAYYNEANIDAGDTIVDKREKGWTFQRIAEHLNVKGKQTRNGKSFRAKTVQLLYQRYSKIPIEQRLKERDAVVIAA